MKQLTLLALCAALYAFSSCSKDRNSEPDARDQYVGDWNGKISVNFPSNSYYNRTGKAEDITIVKQAGTKNKIAFTNEDDDDLTIEATVDGNTLTLEYAETRVIYGQATEITMKGKGTIDGKKVTASGTVSYTSTSTYNRTPTRVNGTWKATGTKQ